jgi:hypothetical protein
MPAKREFGVFYSPDIVIAMARNAYVTRFGIKVYNSSWYGSCFW